MGSSADFQLPFLGTQCVEGGVCAPEACSAYRGDAVVKPGSPGSAAPYPVTFHICLFAVSGLSLGDLC